MKPVHLRSALNAIVLLEVASFTINYGETVFPTRIWGLRSISTSDSGEITSTEEADVYAVRATLKYIWPDHCLALQFPHLDTSAQRARKVSAGISLDFVLDAAGNTNTINARMAQEIQLPGVGQAPPGVRTAGTIQGRQTFVLGDAELDETGQNFTFMTGSAASTLAIESPTAAGLLSLAFLQSLGGVEFDWGSTGRPPCMTFFGKTSQRILETRTKVPMDRIPITLLPSVRVTINGVEMPVLLDSGSPITDLNAQAARPTAIETVPNRGEASRNPFEAWTQTPSVEDEVEPSNDMTKESVEREPLFEWREYLAPLLTFCDYRSLTKLRATNRRLVEIELERREQHVLAVYPDSPSEFWEEDRVFHERVDYVLEVELGWPERFTDWNAICEEALERADPYPYEGITYDEEDARRKLRNTGYINLEDFVEDDEEYDRRMEWNVYVLDFCEQIDKRKAWKKASESEFFDERDANGRGPVCETIFALLSRARSDSLRMSHWRYRHKYKRGATEHGYNYAIMFYSSDGREVALVWSRDDTYV